MRLLLLRSNTINERLGHRFDVAVVKTRCRRREDEDADTVGEKEPPVRIGCN